MDATLAPRLTHVDAHDDGINAWSMANVAPPPGLAGLIHRYSDYAERTGSFTERRELPHGDGVLIVNLGATIWLVGGDGGEIEIGAGEAFVAGAHLRPALSRSSGAQAGLHVFLPLESLRRLLGIPFDAILDQVVPLDAILGAEARALCAPILEARDRGERIARLDAGLLRLFARSSAMPARQVRALTLLRRRPDLDISAVAAEVGWSRKHLADRTRDAVGLGPRSFRRVLRFKQLIDALRDLRDPDWASIALDRGYCDQSHMIRDFREFADLTPREFYARSLPGGGLVEP